MKSLILSIGAAICDVYRKAGKEFHRERSGDIEEALAGGMSRELQERADNINKEIDLLLESGAVPWFKALHEIWATRDELI